MFSTLLTISILGASAVRAETIDFSTSTGTGPTNAFGFSTFQQAGSLIWEDNLDLTYRDACSTRSSGLYSTNGFGQSGRPDCAATYLISRADGATFSLESVNIGNASDFRKWTGATAFGADRYDDIGGFSDWVTSGAGPDTPQFSVFGYLNGALVADNPFEAQLDGTVSLSGFDNIDSFRVTPLFSGNTFADSFAVLPDSPNADHCGSACYSLRVTGATIGAANAGPVISAVPLPATLPMLAAGLAVFGVARRKRKMPS